MKSLFALVLLFASTGAHAQKIDYDALAQVYFENICYLNTPGTMPKKTAKALCKDSPNEKGPIECYNASSISLSDSTSVKLCQKARGVNQAITCANSFLSEAVKIPAYKKSTPAQFSEGAERLCYLAKSAQATVGCFVKHAATMPFDQIVDRCND